MRVFAAGPDCDKLDVIFALDSSASVGAENWIQLRQFTVDLIERLNIGRDKTQVSTHTRISVMNNGS